jgi:hypothetical protein
MFDCFFSGEGFRSVNVGSVLDYSLTIHATTIRFGFCDTVRESLSISADLGRAPQISLLVTSRYSISRIIFMNILHAMADLVRKHQRSSSGIGRETHEI